MLTNADLTWYAHSVVDREEVYTRSVIRGVMWEDRRAANARRGGEIKADDIAVYIPMAHGGEGIKAGDLIVRGAVTDEITASFTPAALRAKYQLTSGVVKSVDTMRAGSRHMWHYQLGAA